MNKNRNDFEKRLERAVETAGQRRSVAEDVLRAIQGRAKPVWRSRWRWAVATGFAAASGIAAVIAIVVMLMGTGASLTLADVQAAFERETWMHTQCDAGWWKEGWTNLQTGEDYTVFFDGDVRYGNRQTNTDLLYMKTSGHILQQQMNDPSGKWTPQTAWERVVGPYERGMASQKEQVKKGVLPYIVKEDDVLNGKKVVRFDEYSEDALGKRFLLWQLWADPATHLPVQSKERLSLGERERWGKEWSTGVYDFPQTGPADIYALGVPKETPIRRVATTIPDQVKPILDAIERNRDGFLKHYRAVVVDDRGGWVDCVEVIWRDGEKIRCDHHLPGFDGPKLVGMKVSELLAWADKNEPAQKELMNKDYTYAWSSRKESNEKPQVHVNLHRGSPLLATMDFWPENSQWLSWMYYRPNFQLLEAGPETPAGCIGLRYEGNDSRQNYYFDPQNDYVCVKQISWTKSGTEWTKEDECTLEDLHRVEGRVVAGKRVGRTLQTIDLVPMSPADYPAGIFDPKSLTTGATVEGY
ncbi:MAG: hypothetical protein FWD61_06070 [Phycisphaerales bacterium]|nr:hypothetical protein [Phycisphaerales bacterium]